MDLTLHTLTGEGGEALRTFTVREDAPAVVGRSPTCEVCLPDDRVSRKHASLLFRHPTWFIVDLESSQGTFVNGTRLTPNTPTPLEPGDLVRIASWTFRVFVGVVPVPSARTIDDTDAVSRITSVGSLRAGAQSHSARCLRLLADCMTTFNSATDEQELALAAVRTVLDGSGYARAAVLVREGSDEAGRAGGAGRSALLGPAPGGALSSGFGVNPGPSGSGLGVGGVSGGGGGHEQVSVLASARADEADVAEFVFSGSLVRQAATGQTAILTGTSTVATHSIADLSIHSALCAPVFLGDTVEGFLYLDARGNEAAANSEAPTFCQAVARAYGLALANLKRRELERRQAALQAEMHAAREAQQFILPPLRGEVGCLSYAMQMRPGLFVAGDLFDVVELSDGRIAVCFGDVAGHGIGSAMLMAATQSHLNAQIRATGDPAAAMTSVNKYLADRLSPGRFVSIWLGVFSSDGTLTYVDAGHGHWLIRQSAGGPVGGATAHMPAQKERAIPVGIFADTRFNNEVVKLEPGGGGVGGGRVVLFSDGVVEQRDGMGREFGRDRLVDALRDSGGPAEDVSRVFAALEAFNRTATFNDDATAASVVVRPLARGT